MRLPEPAERPWLTVGELAAITGEGEKAIRAALHGQAVAQLLCDVLSDMGHDPADPVVVRVVYARLRALTAIS